MEYEGFTRSIRGQDQTIVSSASDKYRDYIGIIGIMSIWSGTSGYVIYATIELDG